MESSDESQHITKRQLSSRSRLNNAALLPRKSSVPSTSARPPQTRITSGMDGSTPSNCSPSRKLQINEEQLCTITEKPSQLYFQGVGAVKIPKEEAVCRFCFNLFQEDNVLKTKCKCKFTLIHEPCTIEWSDKKGNKKCDVCEQDMQNIPVTLSMNHNSSDTNKKVKGNSTPNRFYGTIAGFVAKLFT
ncbi:hypothetical protein CDL12_01861 [Handroanthus impetiginosus]|uniref:RING-CH-type domain-containing protein n=1 Tax=Handroanthus impetiginosus TaxID=429701 RepID=A0A2G9I6K3_9LAMI|nr:hypothetical protein CDL12_01861 [Handroanthus impetiginosus]